MTLLAIGGWLQVHYLFHHPGLCTAPMTRGFYRSSLVRIGGLIAIAVSAVGIAMVLPAAGNMAFMLTIPISVISKRFETDRSELLPPRLNS